MQKEAAWFQRGFDIWPGRREFGRQRKGSKSRNLILVL
jgi:hypothetical protein